MQKHYAFSLSLSFVLLTLCAGTAQAQQEDTHDTLYAVATYDPARDPAEDLARTVRQAQASGKRILLEVGGAWCTWCHALDKYIHENEAVARALRQNFLIMKVNYSQENKNEAFLAAYPDIPGYPHIFVLEHDDTLLHSQGTAALEKGSSYDTDVFLAFLEKWAPGKF